MLSIASRAAGHAAANAAARTWDPPLMDHDPRHGRRTMAR
jgi:hypothetical protein